MSFSQEHNPFAATVDEDVDEPEVDAADFEPEGERLWVPELRSWPRWCVTCGREAVGEADYPLPLRRHFRFARTLPVRLPLCRRHLRIWVWRKRLAWVAMTAALAVLLFHERDGMSWMYPFIGLVVLHEALTVRGLYKAVTERDGRYLVAGLSLRYLHRVSAASRAAGTRH